MSELTENNGQFILAKDAETDRAGNQTGLDNKEIERAGNQTGFDGSSQD